MHCSRQRGLQQVEATLHDYSRTFTAEAYLSGWGGLYRYLRSETGEERWREFCDSAARKIRDRLGDALVSVKRVWIAIGTGP